MSIYVCSFKKKLIEDVVTSSGDCQRQIELKTFVHKHHYTCFQSKRQRKEASNKNSVVHKYFGTCEYFQSHVTPQHILENSFQCIKDTSLAL